uniref:Uncharacterized protein n=1 Tax=Anguilla anguilla TaxID=7936 RepID=A0A0E9R3G6_ANGAN
MTGRLASLLFS